MTELYDSHPKGETGEASWYGPGFHGRPMANRKRYNMNANTAAHRKLPLGTKVRVTDTNTGKHIDTTVTDRGPYVEGRIIDLSKGAARKLDMIKKGVTNVRVEVLEAAKKKIREDKLNASIK